MHCVRNAWPGEMLQREKVLAAKASDLNSVPGWRSDLGQSEGKSEGSTC